MTILPEPEPSPLFPNVTGAILAGGASRRLGRDKVILKLGGKFLARWVADTLAPLVADLWLVTNHPQAHLTLHMAMVTDLAPFQGPVGGLATALFYARTPWVLLTAADSPFLTPGLAAALAGAAGRISRPALICRSERGLEPLPGLYAVRLLPRVQGFLKTAKRTFMAFLDPQRPEIWEPKVWRSFDPEGASFLNLNRPEDLARLEAFAARQAGPQPPGEAKGKGGRPKSPGQQLPH
jgi:molybdopterin-guanine dinucleotide biosynthesis protein A